MRIIISSIILCFFLMQPIVTNSQAVVKADVFWLPQTYRILNDIDINTYKYNVIPLEMKSGGLMLGIFSKIYGYGFETGFIYTNQGQLYDSTGVNFMGRGVDNVTQIKLNYFKIPFLFRYRADVKGNNNGKGGINFFVGGQASLLQKAAWVSGQTNLTLPTSSSQSVQLIDAYANFKIDLALGVGYVISLTDDLGVSIFMRFDYSLVDIENKAFKISPQEDFYPENRLASSSYTIGVGVGLTYSIFGRD